MIKQSVQLYGIRPEMAIIDRIVANIFAKYDYGCVITSSMDSHAGKLSLHNVGFALDYRTSHLRNEQVKNQVVEDCRLALPQCDLGLHSAGTSNEHLHVEFDPKNDPKFQLIKAAWKRNEEVVW